MPSSDLVPTAPVAPEPAPAPAPAPAPVAEVACDFGEEAVDHAKELRRLSAYTTASKRHAARAALRELAASCGPALVPDDEQGAVRVAHCLTLALGARLGLLFGHGGARHKITLLRGLAIGSGRWRRRGDRMGLMGARSLQR